MVIKFLFLNLISILIFIKKLVIKLKDRFWQKLFKWITIKWALIVKLVWTLIQNIWFLRRTINRLWNGIRRRWILRRKIKNKEKIFRSNTITKYISGQNYALK